MQHNQKKMDTVDFVHVTSMSRYYLDDILKRAIACQEDPNKNERLARPECITCFYVRGKLGGAAMTHSTCGICGKATIYGSTNVDVLCPECAKTHKLCRHCGGDLELRLKRRKWPVDKETHDSNPA